MSIIKDVMKRKKLLMLAFVLTVVMTAAFMPNKAYASSKYKIVSDEPTKVSSYYYKIDFNKDAEYRNLYRSKYKNKGYKCIAKHIYEIYEHPVCAVDGKYAYAFKYSGEQTTLIRYPVSKLGKRIEKKLPSGYWILGAAKGNVLLLEKEYQSGKEWTSDIYKYDITKDKLKRIKANINFAEVPAQMGNYVMLRSDAKGEKQNHYIYRITNSGQLKKVKKLGTIRFDGGGEIPISDYYYTGKKIYYLLDKNNSYVVKRCNLNGSNVETRRVFSKSDMSFINMYDWTSKSCKINVITNDAMYIYKYIYKTNKLVLLENYTYDD